MQKEFDINAESVIIEEKILNFINLVIAIIAIPPLIISFLRIHNTGLQADYLMHILIASVIWILVLLKRKIRFELRKALFIAALMVLILPSVSVSDIYGFSGYIAILYSFLAGLFYGKKGGVMSVVYTFLLLIIVVYLFATELPTSRLDNFFNSDSLFELLFKSISLIVVSLIMVFSIARYRDYFISMHHNLIKAKNSAEKHEHKYKQLSSLTFEGIMIHDKGTIIDVNQSFTRMIGYSAEELIGKNLLNSDFIPEKYHKLIYENMMKNYASPYEVEGIKRDGTVWPIEIESRKVVLSDGSILRVSAIRDISYRKKLEDELSESERKFRKLFENSSDALLILENGRFINCNIAALQLFGYNSEEDLFEVSPVKLSPEVQPDGKRSSEKASVMIMLALKNGTHLFEWIHKRKDGKPFFAEVLLTAISAVEGKNVLHVVIRDISERKKDTQKLIDYNNQLLAVEEELRASNEELLATTEALQTNNEELIVARREAEESELLYRGIVDNLMGGYYRADAEGKLTIASSSAEMITGFSLRDFLGKPVASFYVNPAERDNFVEQIQKTGKVYKFQAEFKTKNRGNIIVETNAKIIYNDKGDYNGVEGIFYDVTEDITLKKKWEEELILAKEKAEEGDRLKTLFLQNMSHEIRTPLNAILGFSNFIDAPDLPFEERDMYSDIIQKSGNQLLQIVDEIMEMSMLETKNVSLVDEPVCINALLRDLYSMFEMKAKEKGLEFSLKNTLSDKKSNVITDKVKLTKVLRNLLENAIKYTSSGFVEFGSRRNDNEIEFYIKDSGIGIKPENQAKVFDRFIQESEDLSDIKGGLGLGLSITNENVKLLGGKISLESEFGKGTLFYVSIPYRINTIM